MVQLRRKIGGLKAEKKAAVPFPVKSAKDLMIKLRDAADELNMPMAGAVIHQDVNSESSDRGTKASVTSVVRFMSDDGSYIDFVGSGGGMATDDKAIGKAITYSWKSAVVPGLALPDADMVDTDDESVQPYVFDLIAKINKTSSLVDLKALRNELNELTDKEKEKVLPVYIRRSGELK